MAGGLTSDRATSSGSDGRYAPRPRPHRRGRTRRFQTHGPLDAEERRYVLRRTVLGFLRQRGIDSAASLTYFASLALLPIALTLVSALALVLGGDSADDALLEIVARIARPDTVDALRAPLRQLGTIPAPGLALGIGLVLTIWTVSSYATCFGRVLNGFYEVQEGRRIWRFRGTMILLSVPIVLGGGLVTFLALTTPDVAGAIGHQVGIGEPWLTAYQFAKWPVLVAVLALMLGGLYLWAPNVERQSISPISWGALVAIAGAALASVGFGVYVALVGHYDQVYGWLGGAVVLLLWMYVINVVLVYGASLDTEIVRLHQLRDAVPSELIIEVPLRDTTRLLGLARAAAEVEAQGRAMRERAAARIDAHARHREEPRG